MYRIVTVCLAALLMAGCRHPVAEKEETSYQLRGTIVSSNPSRDEVLVNAQAIPGYMEAMTMTYKMAQKGIAGELHPGDRLTARLRVSGSTSLIDQIVVVAQAKPDYKPVRLYNTPTAGQVVPLFKFLNQNGDSVSLEHFRGKVLVVTFVYTRCPLPDYCIRMSRNFAEIQKQLTADARLSNQVHLLSISFDPGYDTPKVLRSYGETYTKSFANWDFVVPRAVELNDVEEFFDVGVSAGPNQTLAHGLSTAVIGPDGKIFRWYPTNDWKPTDVVHDAEAALARTQH